MERDTFVYTEACLAADLFNMQYDDYLINTSEDMREFNLQLYALRSAKEAYYNTPKDKRPYFFADDDDPETQEKLAWLMSKDRKGGLVANHAKENIDNHK